MIARNPQELENLLISEGIDTTCWGIDGAKSIENLWNEIFDGEAVIQQSPLLRIISVVVILVRKGNSILIETEQEFSDGRTRMRHHPPSEKIRPGENYIDAAARCLEEELQVRRSDIMIIESHGQSYQQRESPSYPGLDTKYIIHIVEAEISNLPTADFSTVETPRNSKDPVKVHRWAWVSEDRTLSIEEG